MEKIKSFFQKLIPASITVRSLYWTNYVNEMNKELGVIFDLIDKDEYTKARLLLNEFEDKHCQSSVPVWVAIEMVKMRGASAMLDFLGEN